MNEVASPDEVYANFLNTKLAGESLGEWTARMRAPEPTPEPTPTIPSPAKSESSPANGKTPTITHAANPPPEPEPETKSVFNRLTFSDLLTRPKKGWLIKKILGKRDIGMIYSESGSGKTFIVIYLIFACILKSLFAGKFEVENSLKIAYCTNEGLDGLGQRFKTAAKHYAKNENLSFIGENLSVFPIVPQLYNSHATEAIYQFINDWKDNNYGHLDLLIIDTLHLASFGANEDIAKDAGIIIKSCKDAISQLGCSVLLIHHANRGGKYRGSSAFHGDMDTMLEVEFDSDSRIGALKYFKIKDGEQFPDLYFRLVPDSDTESAYIEWLDKVTVSLDEPVSQKAKDSIKKLLAQEPDLSENKIVNKLSSVASRVTIRRVLSELESEGEIQHKPGKKRSKLYRNCEFKF